MNAQISIITVCYNDCVNLEKTIKSVINQKFTNYQFIIIDGNSTDHTKKILNKYSESIDIIISETDEGIYDAMNKGIKVASGEYLNFLNSGDLLHDPNTLSIVSKQLEKYNFKILSGDFTIYSSNQKNTKYISTSKISMNYLKKDFYYCHQSIFCKRELVPKYNTDFLIKADYDWILNIAKNLNEADIGYINNSLIYYLRGGFSKQNIFLDIKELVKVHKTHFGKKQVIKNIHIYIFRFVRYLTYLLLK